MHPAEYVRSCIRSKNYDELVGMLGGYCVDAQERKDKQLATRAFAETFLVALMGELNEAKKGKDIESSPYVQVWRDLGYYGIDRQKIT